MPLGGLGTCVAELMAEHGIGRRLVKISTGDRYLQGANQGWLMENYGISAPALVQSIETLVNDDLGFSEDQIIDARDSDFAADNQLEAL